MSKRSSIVWFRTDLRLADNPALTVAMARRSAVICIFIWSPDEEGRWALGAASKWWLHQSLRNLDASLRSYGSRLIIRKGPTLKTLRQLTKQCGADSVFWNRRYEPAIAARDEKITRSLQAGGVAVETLNSGLLFEPWEIKNASGKPFQVFTPFWKTCLKRGEPRKPEGTPKKIPAPSRWPRSLSLDALKLEPEIDWAKGIRKAWTPGEQGAQTQLRGFIRKGLADYPQGRDRPDWPGTSRLSPHLHFGEIGPRQIWHAVQKRRSQAGWSYLRQLGWREFAHHLLHHFPHTTEAPLREQFRSFPWRKKPAWLKTWQHGRTGYPLVDAGMRELWTTGWMHNRVRMVVASFLVKDLMQPWQSGAKWFWDTLVDADLANNTLGWQWTAGCGADAAPFFRVFNPVSQGERYDPDGEYVRRWIPELKKLPARWIHKPWEAPAKVLRDAGVELGRTYPKPTVDHGAARERALRAFAAMRKK